MLEPINIPFTTATDHKKVQLKSVQTKWDDIKLQSGIMQFTMPNEIFLKQFFLICMHFAIKGKNFSKGQGTKFFSFNLYQISPKTHPIDLMEQLLFIELAVYYGRLLCSCLDEVREEN